MTMTITTTGRASMPIEKHSMLMKLLDAYRLKRSVDGMNGRGWDAGKHWDAEKEIDRLESELSKHSIPAPGKVLD